MLATLALKNKVSPQILRCISDNIAKKIQNGSLPISKLKLVNYHGFWKGRYPQKVLGDLGVFDKTGTKIALSQKNVQAEIVKVISDLTPEVHIHEQAYAHIKILGKIEGVANPINAWV